MTQAIANNINSVMKYKETIFTVLIVSISILIMSYVYFLHKAISNVVARAEVVAQTKILSTKVSELEGKYFSVKNTINIELAHEKGFKDSDVSSFITKKSLTAMANKNEL